MSQYQGSSYRPSGDLYRPGGGRKSGGGYSDARERPSSRYQGQDRGQHQHNNHNSGYNAQGSYNLGSRPGYGSSAYAGRSRLNQTQSNSSREALYGRENNYTRDNHQGLGLHDDRYQGSSNAYHSQHNSRSAPSGRFNRAQPNQIYSQSHSQNQADNQVWMGDLDPRWTEADISSIWSQVGEAPVSVRIMRDKSGKPPYCFVTFLAPEQAATALQHKGSAIPGTSKYFKLNRASGSSLPDRGHQQTSRLQAGGMKPQNEFSLFVGDLASDVTEAMLLSKFSEAFPGSVRQVKVMTDPSTGFSKGFGFVRFNNLEAQHQALKSMNGVTIGLRQIRLGLANNSQESSSGAPKAAEQSQVRLAQHQPALTPVTDPNNTSIVVNGITYAITRDEMKAHVSPFGPLISLSIDYAQSACYIRFLFRADAELAFLFLHGTQINGARILLTWGNFTLSSDTPPKVLIPKKGTKYVAAKKPPAIFGTLPPHLVLSDLTEEELNSLKLVEETSPSYAIQSNLEREQLIRQRKEYLENAF